MREAFQRCSPSACWSIWSDLQRWGLEAERSQLDYPVFHLARLAAELSVIYGQQSPDRLRDLGTPEHVIEQLKEAS